MSGSVVRLVLWRIGGRRRGRTRSGGGGEGEERWWRRRAHQIGEV